MKFNLDEYIKQDITKDVIYRSKRIIGDQLAKKLKQLGFDEDYQVTALLSQTLYYTSFTPESLLEKTNQNIYDALNILIQKDRISNEHFFNLVIKNNIAYEVENIRIIDELSFLLETKNYDLLNKKVKYNKEYYIKFSNEIKNLINQIK